MRNESVLLSLLKQTHERVNAAQELEWIGGEPFENWNVCDASGIPFVRTKESDAPATENFNDRDYFIGAMQKATNSGTARVHCLRSISAALTCALRSEQQSRRR
ncbi:MAG: hypothetical protein ACXW32_04515 [Limisphaerales bacterium]